MLCSLLHHTPSVLGTRKEVPRILFEASVWACSNRCPKPANTDVQCAQSSGYMEGNSREMSQSPDSVNHVSAAAPPVAIPKMTLIAATTTVMGKIRLRYVTILQSQATACSLPYECIRSFSFASCTV